MNTRNLKPLQENRAIAHSMFIRSNMKQCNFIAMRKSVCRELFKKKVTFHLITTLRINESVGFYALVEDANKLTIYFSSIL